MTMNDEQKKLAWDLIEKRNTAFPISMKRLAFLLFGNEKRTRDVQHIVAALRLEGRPILSRSGQPNGYYVTNNLQELERAIAELRARALNTMRAVRALQKHRGRLMGQQALEL